MKTQIQFRRQLKGLPGWGFKTIKIKDHTGTVRFIWFGWYWFVTTFKPK